MNSIKKSNINVSKIYKNQLDKFNIDIRGSLNRNDIYFRKTDIEKLFNKKFIIPSTSNELIMIETENGYFKYITYNELINQYKVHKIINKVFDFILLINTILDNEIDYQNKKLLYNDDNILEDDENKAIDEINLLDINLDSNLSNDFNDDFSSYGMINDNDDNINNYITLVYQHKIELLNQKLESINTKLQIKDRDIIILKMKMDIEINKKNKIIDKLQEQINDLNDINRNLYKYINKNFIITDIDSFNNFDSNNFELNKFESNNSDLDNSDIDIESNNEKYYLIESSESSSERNSKNEWV